MKCKMIFYPRHCKDGINVNIPSKKALLIKLSEYLKDNQLERGDFCFEEWGNGIVTLRCGSKKQVYLVAVTTIFELSKLDIGVGYIFGIWYNPESQIFSYAFCEDWLD